MPVYDAILQLLSMQCWTVEVQATHIFKLNGHGSSLWIYNNYYNFHNSEYFQNRFDRKFCVIKR